MDVDLDQQTVESFKEVCAVDDNKARQFLVHCDGNLETAVQLFFQTGGNLQNTHEGDNNAYNEELELRQRRNVNNTPPPIRQMRVPVRPQQQGWLQWIITVITLPVQFTFSTIWELLAFFGNIFFPRPPVALTDPRGDVDRFLAEYSEKFSDGTPRIQFFRGSFDDAMREAKNSLRMVLVYLHHPTHSLTPSFIDSVLHSDQVQGIIDSENLLVWGVSNASPQGSSVASHLRPAGYPFIALLTMRDNKIIPAIRLGGTTDVDQIALNLRLAVEDHVAQLNTLRMQRAQREENQRIREEQEREYRESAARDRARIAERRRLESERAEAEEKERQVQQEAEDRKQIISVRREEHRQTQKEEPKSGDIVRIQVRFPSGARLDRRFLADDSLEELFSAVLAHEGCPNFFTAHTTYPRKELVCAPRWYYDLRQKQLEADGVEQPSPFSQPRSFRQEGLEKSLVVMIHDCLA